MYDSPQRRKNGVFIIVLVFLSSVFLLEEEFCFDIASMKTLCFIYNFKYLITGRIFHRLTSSYAHFISSTLVTYFWGWVPWDMFMLWHDLSSVLHARVSRVNSRNIARHLSYTGSESKNLTLLRSKSELLCINISWKSKTKCTHNSTFLYWDSPSGLYSNGTQL